MALFGVIFSVSFKFGNFIILANSKRTLENWIHYGLESGLAILWSTTCMLICIILKVHSMKMASKRGEVPLDCVRDHAGEAPRMINGNELYFDAALKRFSL